MLNITVYHIQKRQKVDTAKYKFHRAHWKISLQTYKSIIENNMHMFT